MATTQLSLFEGDERASPSARAGGDPGRVRRKLDAWLAEARAGGGARAPRDPPPLHRDRGAADGPLLPDGEVLRVRRLFEQALAA